MPHLKVLVCGINAYSFKLHGCIFMFCYTHLNLALSLHKTVLVTFLLGSTVIVIGLEPSKNNFGGKISIILVARPLQSFDIKRGATDVLWPESFCHRLEQNNWSKRYVDKMRGSTNVYAGLREGGNAWKSLSKSNQFPQRVYSKHEHRCII